MSQTPGKIRQYYRRLIKQMTYQAQNKAFNWYVKQNLYLTTKLLLRIPNWYIVLDQINIG